jgi:putative hydrolase of the HAD superfamily
MYFARHPSPARAGRPSVSIVAEFAAKLHSQRPPRPRVYEALEFPSGVDKIPDVRAVIFDVYGTLVDYRRPEFDEPAAKLASLRQAFAEVIRFFGFEQYLRRMNAAAEPAVTLSDFYHGLIALDHEKSRREDIQIPEVRIERIWGLILMMLKRHGYAPAPLDLGIDQDVARCMAYYYHFMALERGFYPGVVDALVKLRAGNLRLGIVSNAQFYTPIDLSLFVRDQSSGRIEDYRELFDDDLTYFSFEYGVAKPGRLLFEKLFNALYECQILPSQTVFVGNDLESDIRPAQELGLRTAFFCGDRLSAFVHDAGGEVIPDVAFTDYASLPERISFYAEKKEGI